MRNDATRDLRRIGAHPDHWYPLAWSSELKVGRAYPAQFAGDPIVLVRPKDKPIFLRWRIAAPTGESAVVQRRCDRGHDPLLLSRLDL